MITSNYSISVNLYSRKTYIFVIKIKTLSYKWAQAKCKKKSARMRHRYFVRTQYGVIKIKSLSYSLCNS
ncbi:hypothetical protein [Arsenophonus endosymbiont of Bemisia tabaci]|uniref:hypothetical protein n=1 Tax=Arsenophonus endosymbiont of Bemisia tabaci TaxID=536059 RepID=UPI0015F595B3|nr:hypothetical protein [Arsenophonus endosymbiont of Bemisia tabaci]CAA2931148.1 hypothetical protein ARSQ2_02296 [Arsenophonus endosymbiont of Bemisia tabaci Q2]